MSNSGSATKDRFPEVQIITIIKEQESRLATPALLQEKACKLLEKAGQWLATKASIEEAIAWHK